MSMLKGNKHSMNTIVSRTDYLPFGVRMTGNGLTESSTARSAWFGFSGKENELWDAESSTSHWLRGERYQHFGARYYDPVACSWTGVDPLAEKYYGITPYVYCAGDPVNWVDKNGDAINIPIALAGAAIDYGFQVYGNYKKGYSGRDMWYGEVIFFEVGLSAVNPLKKIGLARTAMINFSLNLTKETISVTPNNGVILEKDKRDIVTNAAINTIIDVGVEEISFVTKKAAKEAERKASDAAWNAKHTRNISENRPSSTVRAMKAEKAAIVAQQAREEDVATKIVSQSFDYSKGVIKQGFQYWHRYEKE